MMRVRTGKNVILLAGQGEVDIELLWYWVVAARVERLTANDAPYCQPTALEQSILGNCLVAIVGAGWLEAAYLKRYRPGYRSLVEANQCQSRQTRQVAPG